MRDLFDAPRRRAEEEGLADAALEDHLFVELADARALRLLRAGEEDAVQAAVGNRSAVEDRHALRAGPRGDRVRDAVPRDARPQLREFVGWIESGQHVEHAVERRAAQLGERRRAADRGEQLVRVPVVHRHHRHDVLRDDVERVARIARRLDRAAMHRLGDRGAGEEIAAILREDDPSLVAPTWWLARPMRCMPLAIDGGASIWIDEIDRAHVDAELERRRRHQRRQTPGLQVVFDLDALRAGDRSVVRLHERLAGQLVQRRRQSLGEPAAVHEDQRRAMRADQLQQARMNRRPDRRSRRTRGGRTAGDAGRLADLRHVLDRHFDLERELLLLAGVDDGDRAELRFGRWSSNSSWTCRGAASLRGLSCCRRSAPARQPPRKLRHLFERMLRRREADPLRRLLAQRRQPLQRERQVRAALVRHERVDLVDDDRLDAAQRLARVRRQHQVERLRRGDEDVGRLAKKPGAFLLRRVAGADGDLRHRERIAALGGQVGDPGQRRAQVALDVDGQRLQRRDVDDAAALASSPGPARTSAGRAPRGRRSAFFRCRSGAKISVQSPAAMAGQPSVCARVGTERRREPLLDGGMKKRPFGDMANS